MSHFGKFYIKRSLFMLNALIINGKNIKRVFFCGIGGASMSAIAVMMKKLGFEVMGSDAAPKESIILLCRENKIPLFFSHCAENVDGCDAFVYTAAISESNVELKRAREIGLTVLKRSELLGLIIKQFKGSVAVAGTHGKSTVTNMIYEIMIACGKSPFLLAGAPSCSLGRAYAIGRDDEIIFEACEYGRSFLDFYPKTAVILNIEREHTDIYPTLADAEEAFFEFSSRCDTVILNYDCAPCQALGKRLVAMGKKVRFFSLHRTRGAFYPENLTENNVFFTFDAGKIKGIAPAVSGLHNVANTLSAILTCIQLGCKDTERIRKGVSAFKGIKRRFEYIGSYHGADIYDDYAHHPTEIKATLDMARKLGYKRIICAFQPHTYSRTYAFFDDFTKAFEGIDEVIFADIYAAREKNTYGVSEIALAKATRNGKYIGKKSEILKYIALASSPQTLILTMGAGELDEVAYELANLEKQNG